MASGGRRGAGERVLESKHVIGLFLLMLVFSGVFFSLGYVMGRNQYDGQVRAASSGMGGRPETILSAKPDVAPKKATGPQPDSDVSDPATSSPSDSPWKFEESSKPAPATPRLEQPPKSATVPSTPKSLNVKSSVPATPLAHSATAKTIGNPQLIPGGSYLLQVAALAKQDDALALANSLQRKHFAAYVQTPQKDKFYRVQVGPYKDQKSADAAKKGLESAGFKAFYVKH